MKRQSVIAAIVVIAILFLIGVGALTYGLSQGGQFPDFIRRPEPHVESTLEIPPLQVTPPPSLVGIAEEVRSEYPELADLLENPELGSVYKDFYLVYQQGGDTAALALARQRGILNDQDQIVMTLILDTEETAPLIAELEAEGLIVQAHYRNKINILIPISLIESQIETKDPELIVERISGLAHVIRLELPQKATIKQQRILGQGVNVTLANSWHAQGISGKGIKVGIIDLGFAGYEDFLAEELPSHLEIEVFGDDSTLNSEVHGTACAEIIHEMAPDAELVLAYYDGTDAAMGEAVQWLIEQEVDIISNSTGSNGLTPLDGTGFVAELVDEAHAQGIFWVNAAGNEADAHYRGVFKDSDGDNLLNFSPEANTLPFTPIEADIETQIVLSWDDWNKIDQDYELILFDEAGDVLAKSEEVQDGEEGQYPIEGFFYTFEDTDTYYLSIENFDGQARGDSTFDLFVHGAFFEPEDAVVEYSLSSPADAHGAFAVGAVHWADDVLEFYSSNGPTNDGRIKPDLAGPSVVDNASYYPEAFNGTSAAAPHVAGAAALVLEAFPQFSPNEVAAFFQERSIDLGEPGLDNAYGAGRLNLGAGPDDPNPPTNPPKPVAEFQPTSTPRPPEAAVGLPDQTAEGGTNPAQTNQEADLAGTIILFGLCFLCLAGLAAPVLILATVIIRRHRK